MIEGNRRDISLASIAVSVSTAALLGASGMVAGAQPQGCPEGTPCWVYYNDAELGGGCVPEGHACVCAFDTGNGLMMLPSAQCGGG